MEKEPVQATRTALRLSASRVSYGHEQAVRASVVVSAGLGDPHGVVGVDSGATTVCVIRLVHGIGTCKLTSKKLKPGAYCLVARYVGTRNDDPSASPKQTLMITR
jgi:Bacterial Ig-like domain (group 3)